MADECATAKRGWRVRGRTGSAGAWIAVLLLVVVIAILLFGAGAVLGWFRGL